MHFGAFKMDQICRTVQEHHGTPQPKSSRCGLNASADEFIFISWFWEPFLIDPADKFRFTGVPLSMAWWTCSIVSCWFDQGHPTECILLGLTVPGDQAMTGVT